MINDRIRYGYHKKYGKKLFQVGDKITHGWYDSPFEKHAKPMFEEKKKQEVVEEPVVEAKEDLVEESVVEVEEGLVEDPDEIGLYCAECDKAYSNEVWYKKHMEDKHGA